jgi:Kef-type K+ transport system membrane component KefB
VATTALVVGWELIGSIAFGIAIGMLIGTFVRAVASGAPMFALLVCVVVSEIGRRIHLDPLIAMLVAGVWLQNFSRADAHVLIARFESAQLPVFLVWFALAGMRLDLPLLWQLIVPVGAIAAVRGCVLYAGTRLACARTTHDRAIKAWGGIGLIPQAGLTLAIVAAIHGSFPTFGPFAALLLLSVLGLNQLVSPILLRIALVRSGEVGKKQAVDFATTHDR